MRTLVFRIESLRRWLPLALVLGLAALMAGRAWLVIRQYADYPPDFDEAVHALPAFQIAQDLKALRLADVWRHSYSQDEVAFYPFVHSWLTAPFFLVAEPDISLARASGLVFVAGSVVLLYFLGHVVTGNRLGGLISALLLLASLPVWVYASTVLIEAAGLMLTLVWLSAYVRSRPDESGLKWPIVASLAAVGVFFTKYSFGVLVVGAMVSNESLAMLAERRWLGWRRWLGLFGPVALLVGAWFVWPGKFERFVAYSRAQQAHVDFWSTPNLAYYPSVLFRHYANGPATAVLIVSGLALAIGRWREHHRRAMLVYLVVGTVLLTLVPQKETRFGYTVLPLAFSLAALAFIRWTEWMGRARWPSGWRNGAWLATGALLVLETLLAVRRHGLFFEHALETVYHTTPDTRRAYHFIIDETLAQSEWPHLLNQWHQLNNYALTWEYYSAHPQGRATQGYLMATGGDVPEPSPENQARFVEQLRAQGTPIVVSVDGSPAGQNTGWQLVEPLLASGQLEAIASSPPFTLTAWPMEYQDRVLAGNFTTPTELARARRKALAQFTIQLHLYRLP